MSLFLAFALLFFFFFSSFEECKANGVPARIPQCKPQVGLNKFQCNKRKKACNKNGDKSPPSMKWNTPGGCKINGKSAEDSGCQCAPYCGYTCEKACTGDKSCIWDVDVCKSKETGLPTGPITNCNTCLFQKCNINTTESQPCISCDANTECVNGVCLTRNNKPCDSDYHCSSGDCTDGKCAEGGECDAFGSECIVNEARQLDGVENRADRNLGLIPQGSCCDGLACDSGKGSNFCCKPVAATCEPGMCCGGLVCTNEGVCVVDN